MTHDPVSAPDRRLVELVDRLVATRKAGSRTEALEGVLDAARRFVGATTATLVRQDDDGWRPVAANGAEGTEGRTPDVSSPDPDGGASSGSEPNTQTIPASPSPPTGVTLDVQRDGQRFGVVAFALPSRRPARGDRGRTVEALSDAERAGLTLVAARLGDVLTLDHLSGRLHEAEKHLGHLIHIDPLTELSNQHGARKRFGEFVTRARFSGRPLSIIAFEIDGVSAVRERWGRPASDRVVRSAASRARAALRPGDPIARIKATRFVAILPDAPVTAARAAAERIVQQVEDLRIEAPNGHDVPLTCYAGVARILKADTTYEDVVVEVERLLKQARETGEVSVQTGLSVGKEY